MKKILVFFFLILFFGMSYGQYVRFKPIPDYTPPSTPTNYNNFIMPAAVDYSSNNEGYYNYIIELQSNILNIRLNTEDINIKNILNKYYKRLDYLKSEKSYLYLYEDELQNIALNLKKELTDYIETIRIKSDSQESSNILDISFSSSIIIESMWSNKWQEYLNMSEDNVESMFRITNDAIFFKKGNDEWKVNKWEFIGYDEDEGIYEFIDERNQRILVKDDFSVLIYLHHYDGERYREITSYGNLVEN